MKGEPITKKMLKEALAPGYYRDSTLPGFCLRVRANGKKTYVVRRKVRGSQKVVVVTLGDPAVMPLEKARIAASEYILQLQKGEDPLIARREQTAAKDAQEKKQELVERKNSITLRRAWTDYSSSRNLKPNTIYIYGLLVNRYLKDWLELPVFKISKDMVEQRHRALSADHPAQANHIMRILRAILTYASAAYEDENGWSILPENPVKRLSQTRTWNKINRREGHIKSHQLKNWYSAVAQLKQDDHDYLMLLLLTGLRKNEGLSLKWTNIDLTEKTLTIVNPKNGNTHILPLTDYLYRMLLSRWQERSGAYVFPGRDATRHKSDCRGALEKIAELSDVHFALHDLRRTFITTAERLDIAWYALKRLLNHTIAGDVTAGYIMSDVERLREPMNMVSLAILEHCGLAGAQRKSVTARKKRNGAN